MKTPPQIPFDQLSPPEFEQFSYDLLLSLGFTNLNWRKGTGHNASPADQGRDIECEYIHKSPDGSLDRQKWFVECKHYKTGVPPSELSAALAWAEAKQPTKLLFIISNFLSNPTKEYLSQYKDENKPHFSIVVWERPNLQEICASQSQLLLRYGLGGEFPYLSILHPAHIRYLKCEQFNTLDYLFKLLDELGPKDRDDALGATYHAVIKPRYRDTPPDFKGCIGDLLIDKLDYSSFKEKCYQLGNIVSPRFVVTSVVNHALQWLLHLGDTTSVDIFVNRHNETISLFKKRIDAGEHDSEDLPGLIRMMETLRDELPAQTREGYQLYLRFCDIVVTQLFKQRINIEIPRT